MASDDDARQKELERERLIGEIRKRAEEAELKRIEEEEKKAAAAQRTVPPATPPAPAPPPPPALSPVDQRIAELKEKLEIALDRGLADKATPLLTALMALIPADPQVAALEARLTALQEEQAARAKKKQPEHRPKEDAAKARAQKEAQKKRLAELLGEANTLYQREKYEQAFQRIGEIQSLDPENEDARVLKDQVEKAKKLADELKAEEEKRRAAEAASARPARPAPATGPKTPGNVWGEIQTAQQTQTVFEDPEEKAAAAAVRKVPLAEQVGRRILAVRIPVKPLITGAVVIVIGLLIYFVVNTIRNIVVPPKYSLLVFPATSAGGDAAPEYLTEGLTEDLIEDLSVVREFHLLAPHSSFHFLDPRLQTAQTARTHNVNNFLLWSAGRSGENVVMQVALYDTVNVAPRWKSHYECSLRELPTVRRELARAVLRQIGVELTPQEEARFKGRAPSVPEAEEASLRARFFVRHSGEGSLDSAIALFEQARTLDSTDAETPSGLGWTHILAIEREGDSSGAHLAAARKCVQEAIGLDPESPEALRVWGIVDHYAGEHGAAIERMEEAANLAPADAESQRRLASMYLVAGRSEDALNAAELALALDPYSIESCTIAGTVRNYRGQFDRDRTEQRQEFEAALQNFEDGGKLSVDRSAYASVYASDILVYLQRSDNAVQILTDRVANARDSFEDYYRLGRVLQSAGRPVQEWQDAFRRAGELLRMRLRQNADDGFALSYLALVNTRLGEFKDAAQASSRAVSASAVDVRALYNVARMYSLQRDKVKALEILNKALDKHYSVQDILDMDFFNIRLDPDFVAAVKR